MNLSQRTICTFSWLNQSTPHEISPIPLWVWCDIDGWPDHWRAARVCEERQVGQSLSSLGPVSSVGWKVECHVGGCAHPGLGPAPSGRFRGKCPRRLCLRKSKPACQSPPLLHHTHLKIRQDNSHTKTQCGMFATINCPFSCSPTINCSIVSLLRYIQWFVWPAR